MNDKQQNELLFWKGLTEGMSWDAYMVQRKWDLDYHLTAYKGECVLDKGKGLEIGTGAFSMLEFIGGDNPIIGVDPLVAEYEDILQHPNKRVDIRPVYTEKLPFKAAVFDWVVCWNVIDHTPDPELMLTEIKRVLVLGGKLYLHVQFDDMLVEACHYSVWRQADIDKRVKPVFSDTTFENTIPRPEYNQEMYYGVFIE
jgi:ubiquinone/menaquinone biosynthesis C-methylase UbiE